MLPPPLPLYSSHILQPLFPHLFCSFFSFCFPASHPLCGPFSGILLKLEALFYSPCGRSVLSHRRFSSARDDRRTGEKLGENEKETAWANTIHIIQVAVSSLCVSVSLPVWAISQFVQIVNKWTYNIISSIVVVCRANLMALISGRTMTELHCWLPTVAIQRLRSLEDNSFERELEHGEI